MKTESMLNPSTGDTNKRFSSLNILILAGMFLLAIFFWNSIFIYPIKLFVVSLHELSHGIMAVLVGGKIDHIQIDRRIGGYCVFTLPANSGFFKQSAVAAAGYLGSMIWGALIFIAAAKSRSGKSITFLIGLIMLVISFFVIRTGESFGIIFCFSFTIILFAASRWLPRMFHTIFLKFLGLTSCLYVIIDIKEDLIDRSGIGSDADKIARLMGMPSLSPVIGIAWIILAIIILWFTLKITYYRPTYIQDGIKK